MVLVSGGNGQGELIVKQVGSGSIDEIIIDDEVLVILR